MALQRPVPRLYAPIGEFGRRGKQLSVERLEHEADTILAAVGTDDELSDWYKRRDLAVRVEKLLRSIVAAIEDPTDRRIAEAVLATEDEFVDKLVERRKQLLYEKDGITEEDFKNRRPHVVEYLAAALEDALTKEDAPPSEGDPNAHDDPAGIANVAEQTDSGRRVRRRRLVLTVATAAVLALVATSVLVVALTRGNAAHNTCNSRSAAELERCYDGKLPWGDDDLSRCADQPGQPDSQSQPVESNDPPVMGPDGIRVGTVYLRTSPICPTTAWARVVWKANAYEIPPGWQLHSVMYRPSTNTRIEERDPPTPRATPYDIPYYAVSRMIASANGCVKAEVYFARGDEPETKTAIAQTSCVRA